MLASATFSFNHSDSFSTLSNYPQASKSIASCKSLRPSCAFTMLKQMGSWTTLVSFPPTSQFSHPIKATSFETQNRSSITSSTFTALSNAYKPRVYPSTSRCAARRRVRYDEDEDEDDDDEENEGHNKEITLLEMYSQSVRGEALIVHAMVDEQPVEVLISKGFSSCLSYKTSPDPSKSVVPARAVIEYRQGERSF